MNAMVQKKDALPAGSVYRSLKIRLHPSEAQRSVLRRWFAAARLFSNETTSFINGPPPKVAVPKLGVVKPATKPKPPAEPEPTSDEPGQRLLLCG